MRFEILRAVLLKTQVFWYVTLGHCASGFQCFKDHSTFVFKDQALWSFKTVRTTHPVVYRYLRTCEPPALTMFKQDNSSYLCYNPSTYNLDVLRTCQSENFHLPLYVYPTSWWSCSSGLNVHTQPQNTKQPNAELSPWLLHAVINTTDSSTVAKPLITTYQKNWIFTLW